MRKYPEAFTFQELLDWIYHQDRKISLYLELKSPITIEEIMFFLTTYVKEIKENRHEVLQKFYAQLMLYSYNREFIKNLIEEKQKLGLLTQELRIFWVSLGLITTRKIDLVAQIGEENCRLYGVEQGMVIWNKILPINKWQSLFSLFPPFSKVKNYFMSLSSVVSYAQKKNLIFIVGTINNPQWIGLLIKQGINGIVPDDPQVFYLAAGVTQKKLDLYKEYGKTCVPLSMKERLNM